MADLDHIDPELAAVLERIRGKHTLRPEDADLLEHHLTSDSLVPGVRNRAAWNQHIRHHSNAGVYVHADLNDFGQVNKVHGEDAGDEAIKHFGSVLATVGKPLAARIFRKGGDEFVAWLLRPEDAQSFATGVKQSLLENARIPLTASLGIGYGRLQAEDAMRTAKSAKTEVPATNIVSKLADIPPIGWKSAEENIKDLRRAHLSGGREADVAAAPGVPDSRVEHRYPSSAALKKAEGTHPVLQGRPFAMISGEEPRYPAQQSSHEALKQELIGRGHSFEEVQGFYGKPERSFIVFDLPLHEARQLGKDFGQESVVHSDGQHPVLLYTNGEDADLYHPHRITESFPAAPGDGKGWTRVIDHATRQPLFISMDFHWGQKEPLRKLEGAKHPHAYEWHDSTGLGSPAATEKVAKSEAVTSAFAALTSPWGTVAPGQVQSLRHYDFRPFSMQINELARKLGYEFKYLSPGSVPDFNRDNYGSRKLWIRDSMADDKDFGEQRYNDTWRRVHELAHALTRAEVDAKYGPLPRVGALGLNRTPEDAKRAVEWEYLAAHKQRELGESMGHVISDEDFARELNTVMAEAVHRAIYGVTVEPSSQGFVPHGRPVGLDVAHRVIDEHVAPPVA